MTAILNIDTLAQRYGCLPSRLLAEASTFDLFICNSALRYQQIKENEANGNFEHYSAEELSSIKEGIL